MNFSPCLDIFFAHLPFVERLRQVAALGFDRFEFWSWWDKDISSIRDGMRELDLKAAAFCTHFISLTDVTLRGAYLSGLSETIKVAADMECDIIISQVGIAGSVTVGKNVILGGKAGVRDHVVIGDNVRAAGGTGITKDVKEHAVISGTPHMPHRDWLRLQGYLKKLPELFERIGKIEKTLHRG